MPNPKPLDAVLNLHVRDMPLHLISLWPGEPFMIVCPFCGRWQRLRRGRIHSQPLPKRTRQCPGAWLRVVGAVKYAAKWAVLHGEAAVDAAKRRPTAAKRKPPRTAAPAVMQIAAARQRGGTVDERERRWRVLDAAAEAQAELHRALEEARGEGRDARNDFVVRSAAQTAQARMEQARAVGFSPREVQELVRDLLAA